MTMLSIQTIYNEGGWKDIEKVPKKILKSTDCTIKGSYPVVSLIFSNFSCVILSLNVAIRNIQTFKDELGHYTWSLRVINTDSRIFQEWTGMVLDMVAAYNGS